jgi:two-component system phosphate regulon response regulator PhoB
MSAAKLLLVEDDPALSELLEYRFQNEGYAVRCTGDGDEALVLAAEEVPDLIILDWMIEGTSGIEVCRRLRRDKETAHVPIIMLTAREAEDDRVRGLETGADDYLNKPFGLNELTARLRAALRRVHNTTDEPTVSTGPLRLDLANREVTRHGQTVSLTPTEYDILRVLARHHGKVVTHNKLIQEVWGHLEQDLHTLRVNVSNLRRKIEDEPARPVLLVTEAGVGYRLVLHETDEQAHLRQGPSAT